MTRLTPHGYASCCCCFIAPPHLLARLIIEGSAEEREAALLTLASSASVRGRRSIVTTLLREDETRAAGLAMLAAPTGAKRTVFDAQHGGQAALPGQRVRGEGDSPSSDDAVNEAYDASGTTYDFYEQVFGRDSVDGKGMELVSSVHFGSRFGNALWNGSQMIYGDGDGVLFGEGKMTTDISVIGHELTHGVTQFTAALVYHKQAGALNESFSDVFGSLVKQKSREQTADQADWLIGEGIMGPGMGEALRSLKAPGTAFKYDNQPAHMDHYVDLPDDTDPHNDNGGVHVNSGIPNHAFYLAAIAIGGNAWEAAGHIWYRVLTERLHANADFKTAAEATVDVAGQDFPDAQEAVRRAWQQVGVL